MVPKRMEKPVRVRSNAAGTMNNGLAQACSRIGDREFEKQASVYIHVRRRIGLQGVGPSFDRDRRLRSSHGESYLDWNRNGISDRYILGKNVKSGSRHFEMIWIRRNIHQPEGTVLR